MWTCVTIVYLVTGTILTARLLSPESSGEHELVRSPSRGGAAPQRAPQGLEVL